MSTYINTFWVRRVRDDHIKLILVIIQELESVSDMQVHLLAVKTLSHIGQIQSGDLDDVL